MPWVTLPKEFMDNKGIYTIAKQVNESFITCRKVHKLVLKKQPSVGKNLRLRPFQSIQVDYAEDAASWSPQVPLSNRRPFN